MNDETLRALRQEVGNLRARDVDRDVAAMINRLDGDVTTAQIEEWERAAYVRWRTNWPTLNGLLFPTEPA